MIIPQGALFLLEDVETGQVGEVHVEQHQVGGEGRRELEADIRKWVNAWNDDPQASSGPRPPNRSWAASDDSCSGSQIRVTSRRDVKATGQSRPSGHRDQI